MRPRTWPRSAALALVATLVATAPASAHTNLIGGSPEPGGLVATPPDAVVLRLDEPVDARRAEVRVVGPSGRRVDRGVVIPTAKGLRATVRGTLRDGGYSVVYRFTSPSDGHTIAGGYSFSIGSAPAPPPRVPLEALLGGIRPGAAADAELSAARALRDGGLLVAIGALLLLIGPWRWALADASDADPSWRLTSQRVARRLRRLVAAAAVVGAVGSLAVAALQDALARGGGVLEALNPSTLGDALDTRFGAFGVAGAVALLLLALSVSLPASPGRGGELRVAELGATGLAPQSQLGLGELVALMIAVLLPCLPGLTGHASDGGLAQPASALHVLAAAVWVGGVAALAAALTGSRGLPSPARRRLALALFERFSPIALAAVAGLVLSGVVQAALSLGSLADLADSAYGRTLAIKAGVVLLVLGVALTHRARRGAPKSPIGGTLAVELGGLAVVLVVTGLLAQTAPPSAAAANGPAAVRLDFGAARLEGTLAPARVGANTLAFGLVDRRGRRVFDDLEQVTVTARAPDGQTVRRTLPRAAAGTYRAPLQLSASGRWRLTVALRIDRFYTYRRAIVIAVD